MLGKVQVVEKDGEEFVTVKLMGRTHLHTTRDTMTPAHILMPLSTVSENTKAVYCK